jgi:hypothetical protein
MVEVTKSTYSVLDATSINTITQTPRGIVTVYYDTEGRLSTVGVTTLYEIAIYQTVEKSSWIALSTQCS